MLAGYIRKAKRAVVYTGAGISTVSYCQFPKIPSFQASKNVTITISFELNNKYVNGMTDNVELDQTVPLGAV